MIRNQAHLTALLIAPALTLGASSLASANLLTNASFETPGNGEPDDWAAVTTTGSGGSWGVSGAVTARTGDQVLRLQSGWGGSQYRTTEQAVAGVAPGQVFDAAVYVLDNAELSDEYGIVLWVAFRDSGGDQIGDAFTVGTDSTALPDNQWSLLALDGIIAPTDAASAGLRLTIETKGDDNATGQTDKSVRTVYFDDASLTLVPEPASLALLGLGGLAMLKRRGVA